MGEHLEVTKSDRGVNFMPPIAGGYGGAVKVYESSGATAPHIWLQATNPDGQEVHLHLAAEDAWHLAEQIGHLVEHHYQGDARPAAVTPEPAGPRVWTHGTDNNPAWISPHEAHLTGVGLRNRHGRTWHYRDGGWRLDGRQDAKKRFDGYDPTTRYAFWALVEQRGPLTEVPAVPSAEPGAGA